MSFAENKLESIPVELPNGTIISIEVSRTGREDVSFTALPFQQISNVLEGIVEAIAESLQKLEPDKASVKFGLEVVIESGGLSAMIVKGSGKGNLEITLEWNKQPQLASPNAATT